MRSYTNIPRKNAPMKKMVVRAPTVATLLKKNRGNFKKAGK